MIEASINLLGSGFLLSAPKIKAERQAKDAERQAKEVALQEKEAALAEIARLQALLRASRPPGEV
ncbi:MAG: hypothetical protein EOM91_02410 [Sphingobacteriia bacterium]|nr:hypothetical protein [Sphingobacteriia bacterium]NCC39263.1 hypothetical protein [Gammaproteobacteria bacterium]